jgi:hypothetical protein
MHKKLKYISDLVIQICDIAIYSLKLNNVGNVGLFSKFSTTILKVQCLSRSTKRLFKLICKYFIGFD